MRVAVGVLGAVLISLGVVALATAGASAGTLSSCSASGRLATCVVNGLAETPYTISVAVAASPRQAAGAMWTMNCTLGTSQKNTAGSFDGIAPYTRAIPLPWPHPNECGVVVTVFLDSGSGSVHAVLSSSSNPPPPAIKGYGGRCADDAGNSSAARAKVQLWSCDGKASQDWAFTKGKLVHGTMCMTDLNSAGSGGKVGLERCTGATDEIWTHNSKDEYVLKARGGKLCLDDPGYSTKNGTQLDVYTCKNTANQHWSLP